MEETASLSVAEIINACGHWIPTSTHWPKGDGQVKPGWKWRRFSC